MRMWYFKMAYVSAVFAAGMGTVAASLFDPDNELLIISLGHVALAVLTFPLGFIAGAIGWAGVLTGFATPAEALFAMTPIHAVLGYIQWWRMLPWLYRSPA